MDTFEISLRLFASEIIAFKLSSQSDIKNWFFIGMVSFVLVLYALAGTLPTLVNLVN